MTRPRPARPSWRAPLLVGVLAAAGLPSLATAAPAELAWRDASSTLPAKSGIGHSMGVDSADVDGDGDRDLVIAMERDPNRLLLNDGRGGFADASDRLPRAARDSEEAVFVDIDRDGDLDIVVANEDDLEPELYVNQGGARFVDASDRLRTRVKANAVAVLDVNRDGLPDVFFGGDKVSVLFVNQGRGRFRDESLERLPATYAGTQHVAVTDVDRDGLADLVLGNEDRNQLYLGTADGRLALAPPGRLPPPAWGEETRDVEVFDANGDGAPDLFYANVRLWGGEKIARSRLLLNDGRGTFRDVSNDWLSAREESTFNAAAVDLDGDGRLDLLTTGVEDLRGRRSLGPVRAFRNTGAALVEVTGRYVPPGVGANGFDIEIADFDGDGRSDVFIASRGGPDQLLLTSQR